MIDEVTGYLQQVATLRARNPRPEGYVYSSVEAFVLQHGEPFGPSTWYAGAPSARQGQCYRNAFQLAQLDPDRYTYVEGWAQGIIPVMHAWVVDEDDQVLEPTWRDGGTAYFGVRFDFDLLCKTALSRRFYGMLDNPEQKYPLLRSNFLSPTRKM